MSQFILPTPSPPTYRQRSSSSPLLPVRVSSHAFIISLGTVEAGTVQKVEVKITEEEKARLERFELRPPLSEVLNLHDFEARSIYPLLF